MPKFDVLVVGSYSFDLIFTGLPGLPELGEEVIASGFATLPGEAFTEAVVMHRLGLKVGWAGDFGNDPFSQAALDLARSEGLDDGLFAHHPRPLRRVSVAATFPQDRSFISYYDPDPQPPAALKALAFASARALFVPGLYYGPLLELGLKLARTRRMRVVMDGNAGRPVSLSDPHEGQALQKAIRSLDLLLPNAREARLLSGEQDLEKALAVLGELCPLVVVKDGPNGAYAWHQGQQVHAPAIPVSPVDTTGAGDCFNAGFLRAWLSNEPLETCLRWGNIVGGLSTLAPGGAGPQVTLAGVRAWLARP